MGVPFFDEDEKYQTGRRAEELPDDPLVSGAWPREPGLLAPPTRHGVGGMTSVSGIEKCGHMPGSFEERIESLSVALIFGCQLVMVTKRRLSATPIASTTDPAHPVRLADRISKSTDRHTVTNNRKSNS